LVSFIALLGSGASCPDHHYVADRQTVRGVELLRTASLVGVLSEVAESRRQTSMRTMRARLHRSDGNAKLLGDFTVRVPLEVLQPDDLTLVGLEAVDCCSHGPHGFDLLGAWRQRDKLTVGRVSMIKRLDGTALLRAESVDRGTASDRGEPGRKVSTRFEVIGVAPRLKKHVLGDVFSALPVTEYPVSDREHQTAEAFVQGTNRRLVAVTQGQRELGIALYLVWWTELLHDRRQRIRSSAPSRGRCVNLGALSPAIRRCSTRD
jgi:hypothetical protein